MKDKEKIKIGRNKLKINKYLVVINFCEEETFLFDSLEEMLDYFSVSSIEQLINKSDWLSTYTVFKVSEIWSYINN